MNPAEPPSVTFITVYGRTRRGRRCSLADRTGEALPEAELGRLLADLIAADAFGFRAVGEGAGIALDRPRLGHVQIGERLYRVIVERYAARVEKF